MAFKHLTVQPIQTATLRYLFTAASVGLESFDSCKIQFSYYIPKEFAIIRISFLLF
jgi:hypothetical protein